jgi:hypothetical protein
MELISIESKQNFYEKSVAEYALANNDMNNAFDFGAPF